MSRGIGDAVCQVESIDQALERMIPHGGTCRDCPKAKPVNGSVFCLLLHDTLKDGVKACGINEEMLLSA